MDLDLLMMQIKENLKLLSRNEKIKLLTFAPSSCTKSYFDVSESYCLLQSVV